MKIKYFFNLILLLLVVLGSFTSCKKDKAASAALTDSIVYHIYSPPLQICTCGGNKYLLDLDFDGVPDMELSMSCVFNQVYVPFNGCERWTTSYIVNLDTVLSNNIQLSPGYMINDSIYFQASYGASSAQSIMSYCYTIIPCPPIDTLYCSINLPSTGNEYFGFAKTSLYPYSNKYGWLALHFDSNHDLYLDGVAINNAPNRLILAGGH